MLLLEPPTSKRREWLQWVLRSSNRPPRSYLTSDVVGPTQLVVTPPHPLTLTQFFKGNLSLPDLKNHCQTFKKTFGEAMSIESWVSCLSDSEGSKTNFRFVGSGQSVVSFSVATSVGPQRDDRSARPQTAGRISILGIQV